MRIQINTGLSGGVRRAASRIPADPQGESVCRIYTHQYLPPDRQPSRQQSVKSYETPPRAGARCRDRTDTSRPACVLAAAAQIVHETRAEGLASPLGLAQPAMRTAMHPNRDCQPTITHPACLSHAPGRSSEMPRCLAVDPQPTRTLTTESSTVGDQREAMVWGRRFGVCRGYERIPLTSPRREAIERARTRT